MCLQLHPIDSIAREMTLTALCESCNTNRMAWDGYVRGMRWDEMGRDPVIAVIVGSRDPTTHLNYLYLSLSLSDLFVGFTFVSVSSTPPSSLDYSDDRSSRTV